MVLTGGKNRKGRRGKPALKVHTEADEEDAEGKTGGDGKADDGDSKTQAAAAAAAAAAAPTVHADADFVEADWDADDAAAEAEAKRAAAQAAHNPGVAADVDFADADWDAEDSDDNDGRNAPPPARIPDAGVTTDAVRRMLPLHHLLGVVLLWYLTVLYFVCHH